MTVGTAHDRTPIKAGIARQKITPPVGVDLTGYVARIGSSNKVHDDLCATALVLDDGATRVGIISLDIIGWSMEQDTALRKEISDATGIPQKNLLIACSHTHSGPAVGVLRQCGDPNDAAVRRIWSQIVDVAKAAADELVDARLSYTHAESDLAWNRRAWVIEGNVQQSPTSGVITDRTAEALVVEMDGRQPVMIFNYACHGVVLGGDNLEISADWMGAARDALESSGKIGTAMFLQGCCGNINPPRHGAFDEVKRAGESVALPLLAALPGKQIEDPKIRVAWTEVDLPLLPLPPEEELEQEISFRRAELEKGQAEAASAVNMRISRAMLGWAEDALKMVNNDGGPKSVRVPLQAISFGGITLATLPGEAFCEYGLAFRKMTKDEVMPVGYANGNIGYIPTAEAYNEGGYEVDNAIRYYDVKMIGPGSEQVIMDAMKSLLSEVG